MNKAVSFGLCTRLPSSSGPLPLASSSSSSSPSPLRSLASSSWASAPSRVHFPPTSVGSRSIGLSRAFASFLPGSQQLRSSPSRSGTRWASDWRSPISLRARIRSSAPVIDHFERKMTTIATENVYKDILTSLPKPGGGEFGKFYSSPALNDPRIDRLPYSIQIILESAIRNCDNFQVTKNDVEKIIDWENTSPEMDFTGVPAVVDPACMRDAMEKLANEHGLARGSCLQINREAARWCQCNRPSINCNTNHGVVGKFVEFYGFHD